MDFVKFSRQMLADALMGAGPDAPTLCHGWRTRHLAAHLVLRESSVSTIGNLLPLAKKWSDKKLNELADESQTPEAYADLVERFASGPKMAIFKNKKLDQAANVLEYFVHTEDIRRAYNRFAPRNLSSRYSKLLWGHLSKRARFMFRNSDVGVILIRGNGQRVVAKNSQDSVAIRGPIGELILFAFGRGEQALVTLEGSEAAISKLLSTDFSV